MAQCDNAAVVAIICSGCSKDNEVMHLVRCLVFISAKFKFSLFALHINFAVFTMYWQTRCPEIMHSFSFPNIPKLIAMPV